MFRIVANGEVELEAEVLETHLAGLKPGARVLVTPVGGKTHRGHRAADAGGGRPVHPAWPRPHRAAARPRSAHRRLRPRRDRRRGARRHRGSRPPRCSSPPAAPHIQVVKDGRVETRDVKTGITAEGHTEILSGLAEGESGGRQGRALPAQRRCRAPALRRRRKAAAPKPPPRRRERSDGLQRLGLVDPQSGPLDRPVPGASACSGC